MRLLVRLNPQAHIMYQPEYHHKLRGRVWRPLEGTERWRDLHDDPQSFPFSFSNPFPRTDYEPGDEAAVLVSSHHVDLIDDLQVDLETDPEFNIGDMSFEVDRVTALSPTVGGLGTTGEIHCPTGIYIPLTEAERKQYDIDDDYDADRISWTPRYGPEPMRDKLVEDVNRKMERVYGEAPVTQFSDLFQSVELGDTHYLEVPVSTDYERKFLVTEASFRYKITRPEQQQWLDLLLNTGIGWRNALGFGFANITEKEEL